MVAAATRTAAVAAGAVRSAVVAAAVTGWLFLGGSCYKDGC